MKVQVNKLGTIASEQIDLEILSPQELQDLLYVETSLQQARQIKNRNEEGLRALYRIMESDEVGSISEDVEIGCPHCYTCSSCPWRYYQGKFTSFPSIICLYATFGGVNGHTPMIELGKHDMGIFYYPDVHDIGAMKDAETFLKGHIEWAEAVIVIGGVKEQDVCEVKKIQEEQYYGETSE